MADLTGQEVLHDPDQLGGGNPLQFTGMDDGPLSRSIGSQWEEGAAAEIQRQVRAWFDEHNLPPDVAEDVRLDVRIAVRDDVAQVPTASMAGR